MLDPLDDWNQLFAPTPVMPREEQRVDPQLAVSAQRGDSLVGGPHQSRGVSQPARGEHDPSPEVGVMPRVLLSNLELPLAPYVVLVAIGPWRSQLLCNRICPAPCLLGGGSKDESQAGRDTW